MAGSYVPQKSGRRLRSVMLGLAALVGSGFTTTPGFAAVPDLPGLVTPATAEHHTGKIVFAELVTPDMAAAKRFYGTMFGWTFRDIPASSGMFAQASLNGDVVAGILQRKMPQGRRPAWLTFISTGTAPDSVDKLKTLAVNQGAKVLVQPHDIANFGRGALLTDGQGAVFGLLASSSGDPADVLADPGEWIWSSLITTDPEADATFYKSLFGYDVFKLPGADDAQHLILASEGFARASINPVPTSQTAAHPRWVNYIRVADTAAMVAKVMAAGGETVLPPRVDRHGSTIALVADPTGALFGLMEWPEDAAAESAK
ncbi:MAG: VOC family protein [Janthinobacterium lividum]